MLAPLFVLVNFAVGTVFFLAAAAFAVIVAWPMRWQRRWLVIGAAVCVAVATGFCMMGQYWIDQCREHVAFHERSDRTRRTFDEERIDQVCRAAIPAVPAVAAAVSTERMMALDMVSYDIAGAYPFADDAVIVNDATAVYAVLRPDDGLADRSDSQKTVTSQPGERLYFRLRPGPWRLFRVFRKEIHDGVLREVVLWDEGVDAALRGR